MDYVIVKYILIGDSEVGKSSLLNQYINNENKQQYIPTIGIEYGTKFITKDNTKYKLNIWDTAGQEIYRTITKSYYRNANCVLLVYDITNKDSFHNLPYWISEITDTIIDPVIILVGNKLDENKKRQVSKEDAIKIAEQYNMLFMEVSANNYKSVNKLFYEPIKLIHKKNIDNTVKGKRTITLEKPQYNDSNDECCIIL